MIVWTPTHGNLNTKVARQFFTILKRLREVFTQREYDYLYEYGWDQNEDMGYGDIVDII